MMVKELRDALVEAGASQTTAEAAAAAVLERAEAYDRLLTKSEFYRGLLLHGGVIMTVMVALKIFA